MLLLLTALSSGLSEENEFITYSTRQGEVRGVVREARNGRKFDAFLGLPFAKPPIGELRWKAPEDPPVWNGIRDATKLAQVCAQDNLYHPDEMKGSEDCLYLNVFTPSSTEGINSELLVF